MSEPSQEGTGRRARASRWNARRRGRSTLKAAYGQAARDVKRMDPAVRERIGRANMTQSDLQQLASLHVDGQMRPDRYADLSERLGQTANARLQQAGAAPRQPRLSRTRNPVGKLVRRYSRWGRNEHRGTKVLKAALKQAARDVKRTDPAVQLAIGRSTLNSADLAALASSRMDQVFRPEGRFQGVPGQQNGAGRQGQGIQSPDAVRQVPQQSEQMNQRIAALQQAILEAQQQTLTLMEENNRLQAEMRSLLEARVQQIQQENAANPALEPGQQREGANQLEAGDQQPDERRTEGEAELGEARTDGEAQTGEPRATGEAEVSEPRAEGEAEAGEGEPRATGEAEVGEGEPRAVGEQSETGERPAGEAQVGEDNGPQVGEGGEPQTPQAGPEVEGAEGQNPSEDWTVSSETQGESVRTAEAQEAQQPTGELEEPAADTPEPTSDPQQATTAPQQPGPNAQQPGVNGQQPGVSGQQPGVSGQQPGADLRQAVANAQRQEGPASGQQTSAEADAALARKLTFDGHPPLNSVSSQQTGEAVRAGGGDDASRRQQRNSQAPTTRKGGPGGREGG